MDRAVNGIFDHGGRWAHAFVLGQRNQALPFGNVEFR